MLSCLSDSGESDKHDKNGGGCLADSGESDKWTGCVDV